MRALTAGLLVLGSWSGAVSARTVEAPEAVGVQTGKETTARKPTAEEVRLAAMLIDLMHPDQRMLETNLSGWEAVARKTAIADPLFSKFEAEYPGTIDAAINNARPAAIEHVRGFVRKAKALKTEIFASCLTADELQQLTNFFQQPTGQRLAHKMASSADADDFADRVAAKAENGDAEGITAEDLRVSLRKQTKSALDELSSDDLLAIAKFESQPVAKKFAAAGAQADVAILEIINNPDPEILQKISEAAIDGAVKFVEAKKSAK